MATDYCRSMICACVWVCNTHGLDSSGKPVKFLKLGDFLILRELYLVFLQTNLPLSHSGVQVHLQVLTGTCPRSPSESSGLPREREL